MTTIAPATIAVSALLDAATCFRDGAETRATEHVQRADWAMARHGVTAELRGQVQVIGSFAYLGLTDRAAEVAENIADKVTELYG